MDGSAAVRSRAGGPSQETTEDLLAERIAGILSGLGLPDEELQASLAEVGARRSAFALAAGAGAEAVALAETAVISTLLARLAARGALGRRRVERLVRRLASTGELSEGVVALVLYIGALREPQLLALPPDQAIAAQLRLLVDFAPVSEASLWVPATTGRLQCIRHVGGRAATRRVRAVAREVLHDSSGGSPNEQGFIHAVPVLRWEHPFAALVIRARPEDRARALVFAKEAAARLVFAVERLDLLEGSVEGKRSIVESSERRLFELGLDLHDGPIQEVAAFADDVRLLRRQLAGLVAGHEQRDLFLGRIDDLEARLVELDRELRELATTAESPTLLARPFIELLSGELQVFSGRHEIETQLDVPGSLDLLTLSQRIAVLRIVHEALTNVGAHSRASKVSVVVFPRETHVSVEVTDNGRGFDVERTLVQAARNGRLGLVGMSERVRLLGGRFDLQSSRGGPTTISAVIPRWRPLESELDAASDGTGPAHATPG